VKLFLRAHELLPVSFAINIIMIIMTIIIVTVIGIIGKYNSSPSLGQILQIKEAVNFKRPDKF